jgi:hypothetical protein
MSPVLISLFAAAGVSAWVYNKTMRYTGSNTNNSIAITAATAVIVFVIFMTVLSIIDSALSS